MSTPPDGSGRPIDDGHVPVAVAVRSGRVESVHHGSVIVLGGGGEAIRSIGRPDLAGYTRSSNKPVQADAMRAVGLSATAEELALACASHDGTPRHVAVVEGLLRRHGLDARALANTHALPLDTSAAHEVIRAGGAASAITMNCSGKHAAMVATCVVNGWPTDGYLDPAHPVQAAITRRFDDETGREVAVGVDGCGAPAHVVSLLELARAVRRLAIDRGEVWSAMTTHPALVGGEQRPVTRLARSVPGLLVKDGAEGVLVGALPDGRAFGVKIGDGAIRAAWSAAVWALGVAGVDTAPWCDALDAPILGHGRPVGVVRTLLGGSDGTIGAGSHAVTEAAP